MKPDAEQRKIVKEMLRECADGDGDPDVCSLLRLHDSRLYGKLYQAIYIHGKTIKEAADELCVSPRTITRLLDRFYARVWAVLRE